MAISDEQYSAWLKQGDAIRCVLIETSYGTDQENFLVTDTGDFLVTDIGDFLMASSFKDVSTDVYISSLGFKTEPTDIVPNKQYLPILKDGTNFTESLDLESSASLSFSDLSIDNTNGTYDFWLDHIWVNREITVLFGDVSWSRADFRTVFVGVTNGINSTNINNLSLKVLDKLQRLNTPMSEAELGGDTVNTEELAAILHGECFNVQPKLLNSSILQYEVHRGQIESIIEVRDNGVPVLYADDLSNGVFTLEQSPYGTITCSAQGDNVGGYKNTVASIIQNVATNYGDVNKRFEISDIDTANFAAFEIDNPQPIGLFSNTRINCLDVINQAASSVGAQAIMSREGKLRLIKIDLPPSGSPMLISPVDMVEKSLKIEKIIDVRASVKLGFCKNWTVQSDLQTGIPDDHKVLFSDEWLNKTSTDYSTQVEYLLDAQPAQRDTLLLDDVDAEVESDRILAIFKERRRVYSFEGYLNLSELQLGDSVTLKHYRYGLANGKLGMVVKIQIDWLNKRVRVGVII